MINHYIPVIILLRLLNRYKKRKSEFKSFDDEYEFLSKEALNLSMQMIKSDLNMLEYLMIILFQKNNSPI